MHSLCVLRSDWLMSVNEVSEVTRIGGPSNRHLELELRAFYPGSTRINHFISLLKTFPFIVIVLRYRAHKSVPSSCSPPRLLCSIPIQSLVSL